MSFSRNVTVPERHCHGTSLLRNVIVTERLGHTTSSCFYLARFGCTNKRTKRVVRIRTPHSRGVWGRVSTPILCQCVRMLGPMSLDLPYTIYQGAIIDVQSQQSPVPRPSLRHSRDKLGSMYLLDVSRLVHSTCSTMRFVS